MTVTATKVLPQYVSTSDPEAVAAVKKMLSDVEAARERAFSFAEKYSDIEDRDTISVVMSSDYVHGFRVAGIKSKLSPQAGRWKRHHRMSDHWLPYANNPIHAEMEALNVTFDEFPGFKRNFYWSADGRYVVFPKFIVHNETAYAMFAAPCLGDPLGDQWEEILTSQWFAAVEAVDAQRAAAQV